VINQVTISEERKKKYDFSEPYTVSGIQALTLTKNKDTIKTAADLAGKKVGVGLGTNYEQWVKRTCPRLTSVPTKMTRPSSRTCASAASTPS
jgi:cystine transport system substrate-binding protein